MKKGYFIISALAGLAISTSAFAAFVFNCPDSSKSYYYNASCHACPQGQEQGKDGACCSKETMCGDVCKCSSGMECDKNKNKCVKKLPTCSKSEYLAGSVCKACPENATCDGVNAVCNKGYVDVAKNIHGAVCKKVGTTCSKKQYVVNGKCVACPKLGTCDGENVKCPYGYTKDSKGYVKCNTKPQCSKKQYLVDTKCVACPKLGTCDGENVKCPNGYTKDSKGYVTCKVKQCQQGSHESIAWIKKHYKNCSSCREENIKAGACSKNKKAHKHYYCQCDC